MTVRFPQRARIELSGRWAYEPLAHTIYRGEGELVGSRDDLPPASTMPVPSNWHDHGLGDFHGRVRFSRDLPPREPGHWWLCFGGVDYHAEVIIDGVTVTRHEGAFDGFDLPLPSGAERLEVVVDAPQEELGSLWPYRKRQFKGVFTQWEPLESFQDPTGGIWGDVWLECRPAPTLGQVTATTFLVPRPQIQDGAYVESGRVDAQVLVEVEISDQEASRRELAIDVGGARTTRVVETTAGTTRHRAAVTIRDPELWWPWDVGDPVLYDLSVSLGEDEARARIGIREVGYDEATGELWINGRALRIRGSSVIPEKRLAGYGPARVRDDIGLIRQAQLNMVRVPAHVTADAFYDACDEAGVLVWQDLPLQWDYLISDEMVVEAAGQAERIVRRLVNHPCVALWSCHNEPFPANRAHFTGALQRAVHQADGTRSVHPASDFAEHAYPGWFAGSLRDYALPPEAPIISEFGALAFPSVEEMEALGASWPPGGPAWDALLHEPTPMLDVAGVDLGSSLAEAVEATQQYQARAVQAGVEAYRSRGRNFLHFLLMDGWSTVSWSVVSYDRIPKLAYTALARACQPVLIGAVLTRDVLSDAWDSRRFPLLAAGVWVVNDTHDRFAGARWSATLGGAQIAGGSIDVAPSAVTRWHPPGQGWPSWEPPPLDPGLHDLELVLSDAQGRERSRNVYQVRMVERGLDLEPPHARRAGG